MEAAVMHASTVIRSGRCRPARPGRRVDDDALIEDPVKHLNLSCTENAKGFPPLGPK